jgi:hypothetical protein
MVAALARGPGAVAARSSRCDRVLHKRGGLLPRLELGTTNMATAGRAPGADNFFESLKRGSIPGEGSGALRGLASKLLTLCAISCAMAVAGCANHTAQREVKADPVPAAAPAQIQLRIHRPNRALLTPQPAPDCELKASDLKTVDPDQWARLKLDYERQCYQAAEKMVRDRLRLLQASSRCEIEPARHPLPTIRSNPPREAEFINRSNIVTLQYPDPMVIRPLAVRPSNPRPSSGGIRFRRQAMF